MLYKTDVIIGIDSHNTSLWIAWQLNVPLLPEFVESIQNKCRTGKCTQTHSFNKTTIGKQSRECVDVCVLCAAILLVLAKKTRPQTSWDIDIPPLRTTWDEHPTHFGRGHNLVQGGHGQNSNLAHFGKYSLKRKLTLDCHKSTKVKQKLARFAEDSLKSADWHTKEESLPLTSESECRLRVYLVPRNTSRANGLFSLLLLLGLIC